MQYLSRRELATGWRVLGYVLMFGAFVLAVIGRTVQREATDFFLVWIFPSIAWSVAFALAYLAQRCYRLSRRLRSRGASAVLADDPRPPAVYLRTFSVDLLTSSVSENLTSSMYGARHGGAAHTRGDLTECLSLVGPVVAVARPGEAVPEAGAARLPLADNEWKERVVGLMRTAALCFTRPESTEGVLWELDTAFRELEPQRFVLLLPADDKSLAIVS